MKREALKREARRIERLYATKEHGTSHSTVLRLLRDQGAEATIAQLEAWGMRPQVDPVPKTIAEDVTP